MTNYIKNITKDTNFVISKEQNAKKQPFIYIPLFRKCLFTRVIFQYNYL